MIVVGVDTDKHEHLARAIDGLGQVLGALTITTSLRGYGELVGWPRTLGEGVVVGIEGAGSYGAGLCEYLLAEGFDVVKVERPRREDRRRGKSGEIDALLAAKKVLAADGLSTPRAGGTRQALAAASRTGRCRARQPSPRCCAERRRRRRHQRRDHPAAAQHPQLQRGRAEARAAPGRRVVAALPRRADCRDAPRSPVARRARQRPRHTTPYRRRPAA